MIVFSGFLVLFKHMTTAMRFVSDISLHKYCLEGLVMALYQNGRPDIVCPEKYIYCHYSKSETILKELGMETGSFSLNIWKIVIQLVLFKCLSYFTLRRCLMKS